MGSSPRLRGTHAPTCQSCFPTGDHPRACGEHPTTRSGLWGSRWIIPALAGNTAMGCVVCACWWDHPRACGEHVTTVIVEFIREGSSPRLRGTRSFLDYCCRDCGIIPALAGNTFRLTSPAFKYGDHPRACGEHLKRKRGVWWKLGSSPRLRGTLRYDADRAFAWRDHPRACGEHADTSDLLVVSRGSSPRLRGTLVDENPPDVLGGIIPALAGNTTRRRRSRTGHGDHPRACGEHAMAPLWGCARPGSSPRLRGTLLRVPLRLPAGGIIPALAGNTITRPSRSCI